MKKNLLFASLLISAFATNAQTAITVNTGDMPTIGQTYIMANDTIASSFGNAGTNQVWNFASWQNHTTDTNSFVNPTTSAGSSFYPTSTIAINATNGTSFMKNSASSLDILGFYADFGYGPTAVQFSPAEKFITFPSNYLTAYSGTSVFKIQIYINQSGFDSMKIVSSIAYSSIIDGWGTITTPAYTNVNSLRQKLKEVTTQTTYVKPAGLPWVLSPPSPGTSNPAIDSTNTYRWWSTTKKFPVAEITADGSNVVTNASYQMAVVAGINETAVSHNEVNIFPNPASDKINISGISTPSQLFIFDVNGRLIESSRLKKSSTTINTSIYENGIYFYQIIALNGELIGKGKFAVSK